jgi:nucleoside-diphosphate-sugar epimerase
MTPFAFVATTSSLDTLSHIEPKQYSPISKAKHMLGYTPTHTISQGMEEAIECYIESIGNK